MESQSATYLFDQIEYVMKLLRSDPYSRRIRISGWNPPDLDKCVLPPCHCSIDFYVRHSPRVVDDDNHIDNKQKDNKDDKQKDDNKQNKQPIKNTARYLDGKLFMRSCDVFLGLPFNVASYATMIHIFCNMFTTTESELLPGKLYVTFGDYHIYSNHISQVNELLLRPLRKLPKLTIKRRLFGHIEEIDTLKPTDFIISNYESHPPIRAEMAV